LARSRNRDSRRARSRRSSGHGDSGPTIEIFSYDEVAPQSDPVANRVGYGHVAFLVEDVAAAMREVVEHGGKPGEIVSHGALEFVYVRDPEDNLIELQRWR
jgi:catechol 2,3-dioxygenase-like lactoylglutathione lyase family enzyme